MNLGIIAASIPTLRPFFVNIEPMVRVASDTTEGPHASDRPFWRNLKELKAGSKLINIPLNALGTTKSTDADVTRGSV